MLVTRAEAFESFATVLFGILAPVKGEIRW